MKKITLIVLVFCLTGMTLKAQDKSFQKGNIIVDLGIGFAYYGTKLHNEYDQEYWTGSSFATKRIIEDTTDAAASVIYPLSLEYGVTNWLGVGARFGFSNYIEGTENDTINGVAYSYKPKVTSMDIGLLLNFHLIKTKRFDMPIELLVGYSKFKYLANNPNSNPAGSPDNGNLTGKDNGMNYGIAVVPRLYFGDHFGMFINAGYMGYAYRSVSFSNNSDSDVNNDNNQKFRLKGNGFNMGIGFVAKF